MTRFNFVSTVDEDGKIQVPFFDDGIMAKCRTEKELRADVAQLLSKYLKNPQISVRVTERKSRPPVTFQVKLNFPRQVDLRAPARLLELISFSQRRNRRCQRNDSGFSHASRRCARTPGRRKYWKEATTNGLDVPSRMYSLSSLQHGSDEANPIIYPGDMIVVRKAAPVYITGEVRPAGRTLSERRRFVADAGDRDGRRR